MESNKLYHQYKDALQKIADVKYSSAVLQWDQETYLPPKGNLIRGRQIATLSEIAHELFADEKLGSLLNELSGRDDLNHLEKKNVLLSLDDYNNNKKLTPAFVRKMSEAVNKSFHAWISGRKQNSFLVFKESLDDVISLKKQEAEMKGYEHHPYNALMNEYDKGITVAEIDKLFSSLRPQLANLLSSLRIKPPSSESFLTQYFNKEEQWKFGMEILKRINFDFERGRQDISEHPFTINFNADDVRITTRIDEHDLGNMTWSCLHEGGHALYEQGLSQSEYGLPLGEYCSLSIHESQSRLWENFIGRSREFWSYNYPLLQSDFPQQLDTISLNQFYAGINHVQPSLIRTEADELTYHFHIMIRYELEKMLIEGSIKTGDIPHYWHEQYQKYLGLLVPDDKTGCLQDVHWSHGSFGYFPTYSTGSLYAAQFFSSISSAQPTLMHDLSEGNYNPVLSWLKQHIYNYGRYYNSGELCRMATGEILNSRYFIDYATEKYSDIYKT